MRIRTVSLAAVALSIAFAANANADLVGSTYDFTASVSGGTTISATNGTYTDPSNPGYCIGPPCAGGGGVTGDFKFADLSPTAATITFRFVGSTATATGSFAIDLGDFSLLDGETITGVTYASGNFLSGHGDFSSVTWNGTDAVFTGSTSSYFDALGGTNIVYDVSLVTVPAPLIGEGLPVVLAVGGLFFGAKLLERSRKRRPLGTQTA